jgi:hypothetical protein
VGHLNTGRTVHGGRFKYRPVNDCFRSSHLQSPWKEAKIATLPKPGNDQTFPQNLRLVSLLSTTAKLYEEAILKIIQRHTDRKNLLHESRFGFRACYSMIYQCMRLMDHVTFNFNNNIYTAAVFLDSEKAFNTT